MRTPFETTAEGDPIDPTSAERTPPSFRAPSGALADSFLLATGATLWDARLVDADALVVRREGDFWSRLADLETPQKGILVVETPTPRHC